jgi:hypothetical protein
MKPLLNFYLYPLVLGFSLVLILKFYEMSYWYSGTKTKWMKKFFVWFSNEAFTQSLKNSPEPLKKVVAMNTQSNTRAKDFSDMTKLQKWQHFLRRKFQETENAYYSIIDELVLKLQDLEIHTKRGPLAMPDFNIHHFSFIKEWENGEKSTREVYAILKTMQMEKVAVTSLTRRLDHYMENHRSQTVADYVLPCKGLILRNAVPLYVKYLEMLVRYFAKMCETDMQQERVTWIEQMYNSDSTITRKIQDMSVNQAVRQLDFQVIPFNNHKYSVGNNLICLDEDMAKGAHAVHWIFAPKSYIDEMKRQFKIKDVMDLTQEAEYIQSLIGAYIK